KSSKLSKKSIYHAFIPSITGKIKPFSRRYSKPQFTHIETLLRANMPSVFKHKNPFSEKMKGGFFIQPDAFFFVSLLHKPDGLWHNANNFMILFSVFIL
ncbi:MAG: hypothetical protein L0F90_07200, partial [Pseudomonadales bacterium]|nr:hypothetical protein [Pseudomonadales bacterium]